MIMNNIRKFVSLVVASVPFVVSAQDIDPTVVVYLYIYLLHECVHDV